MAKKKRKTPKKRPRSRKPKPEHGLPFVMPDRRAMEGVMEHLMHELGGFEEGEPSPLGQAQEVMYQAFEEDDPRRRVALAKQALEISPDCADAYVLLAEHASNRKEALALYEKAVAAGERALGPEYFQEEVGYFWGLLETRPYMRARLGLADTLWTMGRRDEAVAHLQEMLRLNPNDNQGVRYLLASWLLNLDRDDDLERLLEQYDEEYSAAWAYSKALLAFRREGDSSRSRALLKQALKVNKHVPTFLTGAEMFPREQPPYYSPGDRNEAILYAAESLSAWKATPGATTWVRETVGTPKAAKKPAKTPKARAKGPTASVKKRLQRLPSAYDVWQADVRQLSQWLEGVCGEPVQPWIAVVSSRSDDLVLAHALFEETPSANHLWDVLAQAMEQPLMGDPHRPSELQVRAGGPLDELIPDLDEIDVEGVALEQLDQLDPLFENLLESLFGQPVPSMLEMPGVEPHHVARFFQAAAAFYRQAPWKALGYEEAIKVECDRFESGPWYALVMGQSGLTIGLALYEDLELLKRMWAGETSDQENARQTVALTVTFDDASFLPPSDLEDIQRHGWEVAGPEAYPSIFRKERGMSMRPPLSWELALMEGCLQAIPGFVARHKQDDTTQETFEVETSVGPVTLRMSWAQTD